MELNGFNDVRVGDFVGIYDGKLFINTSLVIGKNPKNKKILIDNIFGVLNGVPNKRRLKWITECELVDELAQKTVYEYFMKISHNKLPEKLWYLRLIKLNIIFKKING